MIWRHVGIPTRTTAPAGAASTARWNGYGIGLPSAPNPGRALPARSVTQPSSVVSSAALTAVVALSGLKCTTRSAYSPAAGPTTMLIEKSQEPWGFVAVIV